MAVGLGRFVAVGCVPAFLTKLPALSGDSVSVVTAVSPVPQTRDEGPLHRPDTLVVPGQRMQDGSSTHLFNE